MPAISIPAKPPRHWSEILLAWLAAFLCPALLNWLLVAIHAADAAASLAFLVLVVVWASFAQRAASIALALFSALLFDFSFVAPYGDLNVSGYRSWLSMIAYLLSCVVVNRVAEHARRQTRNADQRREDVERLYELNQDLMLHGDSANLLDEIPHMIHRNFQLDQVLLYSRASDQLYPAASPAAAAALPILRNAPVIADLDSTLLEGFTAIHILFGMSDLGVLAWRPNQLSREIAVSIGAQIAVVITRAHAIEASARLEAARSADRLRAALIDSLTHELRTPLTAIRAAATTLTGSPRLDDATSRELALIVDEESARLDQLIGEAVEIAEIESASILVHPQQAHTGAFLEQAVQQSRAQLGPRRVTIHAEEPDTAVWFDPHILGRALRHLLENAARYTPETAQIRLESRRTPTRLEFLVSDNGPGIAAQELPHIFDKFYRGKNHNTRKRGTGMGLAITRALLAAHGGEVTVQSAPGKGATFLLSIPLQEKSVEV
ncbi:MAG TPA: ATP-binding protein [Acidobacteriaceae bacterium]|nr:ATP-binding protein [Acidobacteriaceae bacterium]